MGHLAKEFVNQGHLTTVLVPASDLTEDYSIEMWNGVRVVHLNAPKTKGIGYIRRTINEFRMPFTMLGKLKKTPVTNESWDGVVWYSPSIFFGPLVKEIKKRSSCQSYLILRDIFPQIAVDIGLLRSWGPPYIFFRAVEKHQYSFADTIGVQTQGDISYFDSLRLRPSCRVEVLNNWLEELPDTGSSISVADTPLKNRKIFVYAGCMGSLQGVDVLFDLAERLKGKKDIGFLFVGRGSKVSHLRKLVDMRNLDNVIFFDEVPPSEIPGLYSQCHVGMVALDPRHKTHNIPGKFLSYMRYGLPTLAHVNLNNDLIRLIEQERVGRACVRALDITELQNHAEKLVEEIDPDMKKRCRALAAQLFSPEAAVKQIVQGMTKEQSINLNLISGNPQSDELIRQGPF